MKNSLTKKNFGRSSVAHGIIILLTILVPFFRGCSAKKPDVVTFIDLSGAPASAPAPEPAPEAASEPVTEAKPEPKPEPEPKPKPEPKPEKKPVLEPAKTNIPPKKVETNTPPKKVETKKPAAVTNAPPKPKTLEERLKEVRQGGKPVAAKPNMKPGPQLDYRELKAALNSVATSSGTTYGSGSGSGGGTYSPFAWYYDRVKQQMYSVWQQPAGAPVGLTASATLRVERDGTISSKSITRRSGNMLFDQSVQNALNDTVQLPVPPADLPDRDIEIEFVLSD